MPSVSEQILQATIAIVQGLKLDPTPTILKRKVLKLLDGDGPGPFVLVAVGVEQAEVLASGAQIGKVQWSVKYPVQVATAFRNKGQQADNATARTWWDQMWPALTEAMNYVKVGLTVANTVIPTGKSVFDQGGLDKNVDWGVRLFTLETIEAR